MAEQAEGALGLELVTFRSLTQRRHDGMVRKTVDPLGRGLRDLQCLYEDLQVTGRKQTSNTDI